MSKYLLSTFSDADQPSGSPSDPEAMQAFMQRVIALEDEMESAGVFVFGGGLTGPGSASVVSAQDSLVTDGPFAESKEQIAGFYIIEAEDDEVAQHWAHKVSETIDSNIEVRRFVATGRAKDMVGQM